MRLPAKFDLTFDEAEHHVSNIRDAFNLGWLSRQDFLDVQRDLYYLAGKIMTEEPVFEISEEKGMKYRPLPQNSLLWGINKMKQIASKYGLGWA